MPQSGAAREALADRSEHNGRQDVEETGEGRKEGGQAAQDQCTQGGAEAAIRQGILLSGGNPQIAKGDGDAPVQAYIAAMPGWKREVGRRLDALIVRTVPGVRKAVKWNSPFYGVEDGGWFLASMLHEIHQGDVLPRHVAASGSARRVQAQGRRYLDIHEDQLDEAQSSIG